MQSAIPPVNLVLVRNLMVQLDVELIVRRVRQRGQTIVVKFPGQIGLRVLIDDGLSNCVDFTPME